MNRFRSLTDMKLAAAWALAAVIGLLSLSACSSSSGPADQPSSAKHLIRPMDIQVADTLTIINNTGETYIVVVIAGTQQSYTSYPGTTITSPIPDPVTFVIVDGIDIPEGIATPVILPDGTKVWVRWDGNIVVVDTTYMN